MYQHINQAQEDIVIALRKMSLSSVLQLLSKPNIFIKQSTNYN